MEKKMETSIMGCFMNTRKRLPLVPGDGQQRTQDSCKDWKVNLPLQASSSSFFAACSNSKPGYTRIKNVGSGDSCKFHARGTVINYDLDLPRAVFGPVPWLCPTPAGPGYCQ